MGEEIVGNPDSGKENADVDNVDNLKKSDKTHSPVSKRKKISNRKYFNEDFDDSPYRSAKRSSIDSVKSDTNSSSSRGRTTSTSTDEGETESETKRNNKEKDRKFVRNSHFKQSSKSIVLIDPSPINPEYVEEKKVHKSKKEASLNHKRKDLYEKKITLTDTP